MYLIFLDKLGQPVNDTKAPFANNTDSVLQCDNRSQIMNAVRFDSRKSIVKI